MAHMASGGGQAKKDQDSHLFKKVLWVTVAEITKILIHDHFLTCFEQNESSERVQLSKKLNKCASVRGVK